MTKLEQRVKKIKDKQTASPMGGRAGSVMTPGLDEGLIQRLAQLERQFATQHQRSSPAMPAHSASSARLDELERRIEAAAEIAETAVNARTELVEHVEKLLSGVTADGASREELRALTERVDGLARDRASAGVDEAAVREIVGKVVQPLEVHFSSRVHDLDQIRMATVQDFNDRTKQLVQQTQFNALKAGHEQLDEHVKKALSALDVRVTGAVTALGETSRKAEAAYSNQQGVGIASAETLSTLRTRITSVEALLSKAQTDSGTVSKALSKAQTDVGTITTKVVRLDGLWPATFKQKDAGELRKATQRLVDLTGRLTAVEERVTSVDARCTSTADRMTTVRADSCPQSSLTGSR